MTFKYLESGVQVEQDSIQKKLYVRNHHCNHRINLCILERWF